MNVKMCSRTRILRHLELIDQLKSVESAGSHPSKRFWAVRKHPSTSAARPSRLRMLAVMGLSTGAVLTMGLAVPDSHASAYCDGWTPRTIPFSWGVEGPQSGTCDGLQDYNYYVTDLATDNQRVSSENRYIFGSSLWVSSGLTSGQNVPIYRGVTDNDSSTYVRLCRTLIDSGFKTCSNQSLNWNF